MQNSDLRRRIKEEQSALLSTVSQLPGFEECGEFDVNDPHIESKFKPYVQKFSEELPKLRKNPKHNEIAQRVIRIADKVKYLQAEERGCFIGIGSWDP